MALIIEGNRRQPQRRASYQTYQIEYNRENKRQTHPFILRDVSGKGSPQSFASFEQVIEFVLDTLLEEA